MQIRLRLMAIFRNLIIMEESNAVIPYLKKISSGTTLVAHFKVEDLSTLNVVSFL